MRARTDSTPVADLGKHRRMPKATDEEVLQRAALLLGRGMRARQVERELQGAISATRVRELAKSLRVDLPAGRPEGARAPRTLTSERRLLAHELALYEDPPVSINEAANILECSKQRVSTLRKKLPE